MFGCSSGASLRADGRCRVLFAAAAAAADSSEQSFQGVMRDISAGLKRAYGADAVAVIPGSGTYGQSWVMVLPPYPSLFRA